MEDKPVLNYEKSRRSRWLWPRGRSLVFILVLWAFLIGVIIIDLIMISFNG